MIYIKIKIIFIWIFNVSAVFQNFKYLMQGYYQVIYFIFKAISGCIPHISIKMKYYIHT